MKTVFSIGINAKGKKVVCKSQIVEFLNPQENDCGYDCVIQDGGILIKTHSKTLFATRNEARASI